MVQNAQWGPPVLLLKVFKDCEKDRVTIAWRNRSEAGADLLVTRERLDAEAGRSVIVSLTLAALAVVLQKRRRLHAKAAKGTSGSVLYRVTGMGAGFANGGEANGVLTQNRLEMIEAEGLGPRGLLVANGRPPAAQSASMSSREVSASVEVCFVCPVRSRLAVPGVSH
jgi:hypothetical protein